MSIDFDVITNYVHQQLVAGEKLDNNKINKAVKGLLGVDPNDYIGQVKESVELAIMRTGRTIANNGKSLRDRYYDIVNLYNNQPIVGAKRTARQMALQQYSTSIPIAFLMSEYVRSANREALYLEPSAGNGYLTIALPKDHTICNEIDPLRFDNLGKEHFMKVTQQDGRDLFPYQRTIDGVVTNPPFLHEGETNLMIYNALAAMKDDGRCAILRDRHATFRDYQGVRLRNNFLEFFDRLFREYNVEKRLNLNSKKVYSRQGTGFDMQIILINGRKKVAESKNFRKFDPSIDIDGLCDFDKLFDIFNSVIKPKNAILQNQEMRLL